ncbi:hypothetical protein EBR77_02665 [bacterium]|nr:hypothetical protein [bacterium]NBX78492.1 hypothetical protein [bacterium]
MRAFVLSFLCMSCVHAALPDRDISDQVVTLFYSGGIVRNGRSSKSNVLVFTALAGAIVPVHLTRRKKLLGYLIAGMYKEISEFDHTIADEIQLPDTIFYFGTEPFLGYTGKSR